MGADGVVVAAGMVREVGAVVLMTAAGCSGAACCDRSCRFYCWGAGRTVVPSMHARTRLTAFANPICSG